MNSKLKIFSAVFVLAFAGLGQARAADDSVSAVLPDSPGPSMGKKGEKGGDGRMQAMLEQRLKQLDETLKLTDDQKQKIKDIWAKQAGSMKDLSPDERRTKGREMFKAVHDQIRAILTPEQQKKFDQMRPEGPRAAGKGKGKKAE